VRDLEKRFGDFIAVNKVNFDVTRGEIFGFLGSNGAGKSTVIRMLVGLLAPSGGSGTVAGYDVSTEAEKIKKHIGYMSQRFSLYDDLTVVKKMGSELFSLRSQMVLPPFHVSFSRLCRHSMSCRANGRLELALPLKLAS